MNGRFLKKQKSLITIWAVIRLRQVAVGAGESSNLVMVNQNLSDHDVLALLPVIEPCTQKRKKRSEESIWTDNC